MSTVIVARDHNAVLGGAARQVRRIGAGDQRLGRRAAGVDAGAAELARARRWPPSCRRRSSRPASGGPGLSGPDDDRVEAGHDGVILPSIHVEGTTNVRARVGRLAGPRCATTLESLRYRGAPRGTVHANFAVMSDRLVRASMIAVFLCALGTGLHAQTTEPTAPTDPGGLTRISCASVDGARQQCAADTSAGVVLVRVDRHRRLPARQDLGLRRRRASG